MGRTDAVTSDPSVADYRATSPASPGWKGSYAHPYLAKEG